MLIQKTFHLPMARGEAKSSLAQVQQFWRNFSGVQRAEMTDPGTARFTVRLPFGFSAWCVMVDVPSQSPMQTLFRTTAGNIEVLGVVEFFEIRPRFTEVLLTVDYDVQPLWYQLADRLTHCMERWINEQIVQVEAYFSKRGAGIKANRSLRTPINGHGPHEATDDTPYGM